MDCTFSKQDRIRKKKDYHELKSIGKVFRTRLLVFNYNESSRSKLGVIVTKKVGNAVFRNKVKRWIREVFRTNREMFEKKLDLVIIPRSSNLSYREVKRDFFYFATKYNEKNIDHDS